MPNSNFSNDAGNGVVLADGFSVKGTGGGINGVYQTKSVTVALVNGAASGSFTLPTGAAGVQYHFDTPVTIPGTPTTINARLGTAAAGQQIVADVDVKTQGYITATTLYPGRTPTTSIFYTFTPAGGTAAQQVGNIIIRVGFYAPQVLV